ncbi:hypothetical protein Syun_015715 [Stephania yunnanensis]|uniref:Cupin type-1 domain-containing protein n=1 Tax=Stephania yunnanensis TaxID=152371 RepID=A0AAP0JMJ1_9MAGN
MGELESHLQRRLGKTTREDVNAYGDDDDGACNVTAFVIGKDRRKEIAVTEYGQISAVDVHDQIRGAHYHLQFITLEPNSLFLPVILHADMIFYVHSGSGSLNWVGEEKMNEIKVERGDVYRLHTGSVFYLQSSLESTREKLRIHAIFTNSTDDQNQQRMFSGAYSSVADMVLGFDARVLKSAFKVPREVAEEFKQSKRPPPIVHAPSKNRTDEFTNWGGRIIKALIPEGSSSFELINGKKSKDKKKKKKTKAFNILDKTPDVMNCNGWSTSVNSRKFSRLSGSNMGIFAVNLTQGSMVAPHWNPQASEIAVVTHGMGMIHVVCPSSVNESERKTMRFMVNEGDVFFIARYHPMVQMAYNNGTFVFMGFSTMERDNYPQFLAGQESVLRTLGKNILAMAFNVSEEAVDRLAGSQVDSTILKCLSCAEEEERIMWEEMERKKQEEEARRKKEEEEKERRRREEEEEEARRRQEEEEERRRREEAEKEEEARKRKEEEEEARRKQEEEARKREEEEEARRKQEEEEEEEEEAEARRRHEEEEARRREEEEQEAVRRRQGGGKTEGTRRRGGKKTERTGRGGGWWWWCSFCLMRGLCFPGISFMDGCTADAITLFLNMQ